MFEKELQTLYKNINEYFNVIGIGHPSTLPCRKLISTHKTTITTYYNRWNEWFHYIVNGNKLLGEKILDKCYEEYCNENVEQHRQLSILNSLVLSNGMGLSVENRNLINSVATYLGNHKWFVSNAQITEKSTAYLPWREFWSKVESSKSLSTFSNKEENEYLKCYHIDSAEALAKNNDGWINNNDFNDLNGLFGTIVFGVFSADRCQGNGMGQCGIWAEVCTVARGLKVSSCYTGTIEMAAFGGFKDTNETFALLYKQHNIRRRRNAMFKEPAIVTIVLYNEQSRFVSSSICSYETRIHEKLNDNLIENKRSNLKVWDKNNIRLFNSKLDDVTNEIASEYEAISTRTTSKFNIEKIRKLRGQRSKKILKYQWHTLMVEMIEDLKRMTLKPNWLPVSGVKNDIDSMSEMEQIIDNVCQRSIPNREQSFLPLLEDFEQYKVMLNNL